MQNAQETESVICSECQFQNQPDAKFCRRCKFPFDGEWSSLVSRTIGNYRLVRRVGGGGFGAVYHAKHVTLGNSFAVKILHPNLAKEGAFIERFQQEAFVLAELRHEHVVQVIDFGFIEEIGFYLITEWLEGRNLYRIWRRHPNLDRGWLFALFSQLLDALQFAHERGIVHRDLKPENLMLTAGARNRMLLKIVDFGIAKIVEQGAKSANGAERRSAMAVGTPYYMAPEQVQGLVDRIGPCSDLYACGIILAEMLTGQRVFEAGEQRETMRLHLEAEPPRLSELHPEGVFSEELEAVVAKSLQKNPDDRFANAQEFYHALKEALEGMDVEPIWEDIYQPQDGVAAGTPARRPRPEIEYRKLASPSSPSVWPALMLGLIFLVAVLGGGWVYLRSLAAKQPPNKIRTAPKQRTVATGWGSFTTPPVRDAGAPTPPVRPPASAEPATSDAGAPDAATEPVEVPDKAEDAPEPRRVAPGVRKKRRRNTRRRRRRRSSRRTTPPRTPARPAPVAPTPRVIAPPPRPRAVMYTLILQSNPPGGKVYVNGSYKGKTPLRIRGEKGALLRIRATMDGKVELKFNWNVEGDKSKFHQFIEDL